jgi:hypothetical protein
MYYDKNTTNCIYLASALSIVLLFVLIKQIYNNLNYKNVLKYNNLEYIKVKLDNKLIKLSSVDLTNLLSNILAELDKHNGFETRINNQINLITDLNLSLTNYILYTVENDINKQELRNKIIDKVLIECNLINLNNLKNLNNRRNSDNSDNENSNILDILLCLINIIIKLNNNNLLSIGILDLDKLYKLEFALNKSAILIVTDQANQLDQTNILTTNQLQEMPIEFNRMSIKNNNLESSNSLLFEPELINIVDITNTTIPKEMKKIDLQISRNLQTQSQLTTKINTHLINSKQYDDFTLLNYNCS